MKSLKLLKKVPCFPVFYVAGNPATSCCLPEDESTVVTALDLSLEVSRDGHGADVSHGQTNFRGLFIQQRTNIDNALVVEAVVVAHAGHSLEEFGQFASFLGTVFVISPENEKTNI